MKNKSLKNKIASILRWTGWVLLVQFILINISAAFYADKLTRYYDNLPGNYSNSEGNIFTKSWKLFTGPRYPRPAVAEVPVFPYDTVTFFTAKNIRINAWYGRPDAAARGTVILFHGITVTKSSVLDEANEFRYLGYNVLLVDFRGHGNSDGNTTTIGYREAEEVKLAFEYISKGGEKKIYLYGFSMGAVAVARAVSIYDLHPAGVILEAPFLSLQTYLKGKAGLIGFPRQPFAFFTTFWIGVEKGFGGFSHKTIRYVKGISCPVLLQWGTMDNFVSRRDIDAIFKAMTSPAKKMVVYEGAQHESLLRFNAATWRKETEAFLQRP